MKTLTLTENTIALILVLALMLGVYHFYGRQISRLITFAKISEASK